MAKFVDGKKQKQKKAEPQAAAAVFSRATRSEESMVVTLLGIAPAFNNAISPEKLGEIMAPQPGGKTKEEKATTTKQDPVSEFRKSVYRIRDERAATLIGFRASAIRKIIVGAAGLANMKPKAVENALWFAKGDPDTNFMCVWGIPLFDIRMVKQGGMVKVPTGRARAYMPEWCAQVTINYTPSTITRDQLLAALQEGGRSSGLGDNRKNSFGRFEIVNATDPRVVKLQKTAGRAAQVQALEDAVFSNEDTQLTWEVYETRTRGFGLPYTKRG